MNRKSKLMLATLAILAILIAPMFYVPTLGSKPGQFDPDWHGVVYGVLEDDYYDLYPYADHSLDVGFSKWGELIGIDSVLHPAPEEQEEESWVGLRYCGVRDPFAGNPLVPMTRWLNGWFIDIEYVYKGPLPAGVPRNRWVWAFAMFADGLQWGFDWNNWVPVPTSGLGGRQTNKYCKTEDMKILYHGPRRFVAEFVTHIYDGEEGLEPWPVVDLIMTLIFNKDKKQVILLKDVKLTIPAKNLKGKLDVELSNREQWDLGPDPDKASYAHLYHQELETTYGDEWHVADEILRPWWGEAHGDGSTRIFSLYGDGPDPGGLPDFTYRGSYPLPGPIAPDFDLVWIDEEPYTEWPEIDWKEMAKPDNYDINYATGMITFKVPPPSSARVIVKCKWIEKDYFPHQYDLAQLISRDMLYVGWAAFWPVLSEYTVDGWDVALKKLVNVTVTDLAIEPETPFLIGQWDFLLDHINIPHYRCVEVKGVTDLWDGDDADTGGSNVPDREVMYQLDEIFSPWDIWNAVHKDTKRWVEFFTGNGISTVFELPEEKEEEVGVKIPTLPVMGVDLDWNRRPTEDPNSWDRYSTFAERILVNGKLQVPLREVGPHAATTYSYNIDPYAGVIKFVTPPPLGAEIKVLWSSPYWETKAEQFYGDGRTERFPLHHDILPGWEYWMEVFFVEQPPEPVEVAFDDSDLIETTEQLDGPDKTIPAGTVYDLRIPFVEGVTKVRRDSLALTEGVHYTVSYGQWTRITTKVDITVGHDEYLYADYTYWTLATIKIPPEWLCKELDIKYHIKWRVMKSQFVEEKFHLSKPRPIDLAFVIDDTGSMLAPGNLNAFKLAVPGILDAACKASMDDIRVSLVTFGDTITVDRDWTTDVGDVESAILGLVAGGDSGLPEASDEALNTTVNALFERPGQTGDFSAWREHANKIIVIITDSVPGGFNDTFDDPADMDNAKKHADTAAAKGIRIFSVEANMTSMDGKATEALQYYAAVTGGRYIKQDASPDAVVDAFEHMLDGLLEFTHTLKYPADYIEKAWIHSEKALAYRQYWWIEESDECDWLVLQQPVPKDVELKVVFKVPSGRYEWVVVGRDSRAVDSAGAAMVAAAFKNKNMEIGLGGLDMQETLKEWGPAVPNIMRILRPEFSKHEEKPGYYEWSKECYRDADFGPCSGKTALKDDWCTTWPISSSNIITLGSSYANLATEYFNEFTEAYLDVYTGDIVALTCWSKNHFKPTFVGDVQTVGYAVIATYKDLNGTVGLTIWGWTGQDTYFACKWFDEYKFWLQHINPHVTAMVLKIDYTAHEPYVTIEEKLGTFSEKPPHPDP